MFAWLDIPSYGLDVPSLILALESLHDQYHDRVNKIYLNDIGGQAIEVRKKIHATNRTTMIPGSENIDKRRQKKSIALALAQ